jgi:carboxyl-terminal processing protease
MTGMLVISISFLSFTPKANDDKLPERQKLLSLVGSMLEQRHYLAPAINDDFSKEIWKGYLKLIDARKAILLQADLDSLKKYETYLDNEIHGDSIRFFPEVTAVYARRYEEAAGIYRRILLQPFIFSKNDSIQPNQDPADFPGDNGERIRRWKNNLKYAVLQRLVELQDLRTQSKPGDSTYHKTDAQLEAQARQRVLNQYNRLYTRFVSYNESRLFSNYVNVITHYADPHSDYFPPLEKRAFDQSMANRFYGIGAQMKEEDGIITITSLEPGSPSWKSGVLEANDQVIKVGQGREGELKDVTGMALEDVVKLIRGEQGTVVRLGCKKADGTVVIVALIREEIKKEDAFARSAVIRKGDKKIGYIYLPVFYDDFAHVEGAHCAADVAAEIRKLKAEQVSSIIMDLRNNGGGSLGEVIKMVGLFIGSGPVVQVKSGQGIPQVLKSNNSVPLYDGPLTVLVNELSASASEIFAAAIQDYRRGIIIGSTTFGKGTVQRTLPLGEEAYGAVKLTTQKFYRVNGGSTQQKGVIPDIIVPDIYATMQVREGNRPFALQWDRIPEADYQLSKVSLNLDTLVARAAARVAADTVFKTISNNNTLLENYQDKQVRSVSLMQYKAQLATRRKIVKQNEMIQALPKEQRIDITPLPGIDLVKDETYRKWLEKRSADVYINQAVTVVLELEK